MQIYFVTSNPNKVREVEKILGFRLRIASVKIKEIQAIDVEEVAKEKARKAYEIIRKPVIVEDTGLYINAWNGFPGAMIKLVLKTIGQRNICSLLGKDRRAFAKTCVCFCNHKLKTFTGIINGSVSKRPKGKSGFGWDPIFIPKGFKKTFAEMGKEKNKISMRMKAFLKLKEFLQDNFS